ncbi:MAG: hypothetical protein M1819_005886 [Sarea resinae]|nr:MAG: hypothetical protein M1819_005886 [Sarea resinae]
MATLLTGGTGKTSVRVARLMQEAKLPFLLASRRGPDAAPAGMPAVKFDWLDASTYSKPFEHRFPGGESISAVYMMNPVVDEPETSMNAFVDYAIKHHGIKRFVLVAGSSAEPGKKGVGNVWKHFLDTGVDYAVLRPTWFMENYTEEAARFIVRDQDKIITACGEGQIPFVSASDIAAVAFRTLTDKKPHNTDYRILGPELLTHDDQRKQLAAKLSHALGRKIANVKLSEQERYDGLIAAGLPEHFARFFTNLEVATAGGFETRTNNVVEQVTGRPPKSFDTFAEENKAVWQKE